MSLISYLAEDNETIARNLIETLKEICEVKVVAVGTTQNEASQWLAVHDEEWDLAIVDLFLKEGSGLGVLAGCRNRSLRQKVVVLTNYATPEIRKRATELGANAVFDKSSELEQLFAYCAEQTGHSTPLDLPPSTRLH
jgi:two-component system, OmpR family, response regulator